MENLFLEALSASISNQKVTWEHVFSNEQWQALFELADCHHVLPMIYDAVSSCPAANQANAQLFLRTKKKVFQQVFLQINKTSEFTALYRHLEEKGLQPVLIKGLVCRELYPNPDYRSSNDEDLLIFDQQFLACHEAMLEFGMFVGDPTANLEEDYEIPYRKQGSPLYIELHRHLFPPQSGAYGNFNDFFTEERVRTVQVVLQGNRITTLAPTEHLLYLFCHAYKHFLHSGFGIRQLCDITLFAKTYCEKIDWNYVYASCKKLRAEYFVAAMLKIARDHLSVFPDCGHMPELWKKTDVDEKPLLADILSAGVFGKSSESRVHSSNMTLEAVADSRSGSQAKPSLRTSLFPALGYMRKRYRYLEKYPFLLPVAWVSRIASYAKSSLRSGGSVTEAMDIGNERIELLRHYGIIE